MSLLWHQFWSMPPLAVGGCIASMVGIVIFGACAIAAYWND